MSDFKFVEFTHGIDDDDDGAAAENISPVSSLFPTLKYDNCESNPILVGSVPINRFPCTFNTSSVDATAINNSCGIVPYKLFESTSRKEGK